MVPKKCFRTTTNCTPPSDEHQGRRLTQSGGTDDWAKPLQSKRIVCPFSLLRKMAPRVEETRRRHEQLRRERNAAQAARDDNIHCMYQACVARTHAPANRSAVTPRPVHSAFYTDIADKLPLHPGP